MALPGTSSTFPNYETLAGTWESPEVEPLPGADGQQIFLVRAFDFDNDAWRVRFSGWADQERRRRLFDGVAEGSFELDGPWSAVPGAQAAIFRFTRRLFMVHTRALAQLLTDSKAGRQKWSLGIQQDVSHTGALFVPTLTEVSAEYDLLVLDTGPRGELDLYLGDRSHEMNSPDRRPLKRNPFSVRKID